MFVSLRFAGGYGCGWVLCGGVCVCVEGWGCVGVYELVVYEGLKERIACVVCVCVCVCVCSGYWVCAKTPMELQIQNQIVSWRS